MLTLIARRVALSVPLVIVVSFLTFFLQWLAPGDAARTILGPNYTVEAYEKLRESLGLDRPLLVQYGEWLASAVRGDLGTSPISGLDVGDQIASRFGVTLSLAVLTTLVAGVIGITLGVISAVRGGAVGRLVDVLSLLGYSLPAFWVALLLVALFAVQLRWLPATGYVRPESSLSGWLLSLLLPVAALSFSAVATISKQTRDGMLDALGRDFIHVARANGARPASIVLRHALRNAAIPVVTVIGLVFVALLGGVVLIETVFAMPGLGALAVGATIARDFPVVQGVAVTMTVLVVAVNLVIDLVYGLLNPKARVS